MEVDAAGTPVNSSEIMIQNGGHSHVICFLANDRVVLDGREYSIDIKVLSNNRFSLILNNVAYRVDVSPSAAEIAEGGLEVTVKGWRYRLAAKDRRTELIQSMTKGRPAPTDETAIRAPMPGLVGRILAERGMRLGAGEGVMILEAMKMENEIRCQSAGLVKEIKVIPGQTVEKNQLLAVISIEPPQHA